MRLLYVALTRAADRLIVSGVRPRERKDGADPRPANSWHVIVERAMRDMPGVEADAGALRYASGAAARAKKAREKIELPSPVVPDWARAPAPPESRPPRPLAPSAIAADVESAPPPSEAMRAAARRGTIIHQLLERLPALPTEARAGAALKWLEAGRVDDEAERHVIVGQVCALIADPRFSALFGPGSLGEAPIAATLPDGRVIAGTIDRLLVEECRVSVIDFKTGRVPSGEGDVPEGHRAQMEAYSEALQVIFPGRDIHSALLYTAGPKLIELMP